MKKIILLFAQIAISLHFMAQSVRPNRINLADQEAQVAPTTPSTNGMVDSQSGAVQTASPKVKSTRINLADKDVKSTQPLFIQGASVDTPSQTNNKIKTKPQIIPAAVIETVVVEPAVSKRPVRINLADQDAAPTQSVVSQKTSVDLPARSIQKPKSVVQAPVAAVAETVAVEVAPVVSKRPIRINLADQEAVPTQPAASQRTSADLPARSIQKPKSVAQAQAPVAPVAEPVAVELAPVVSKRPVRINLADQETAPTQSIVSQKTSVDLPARSIQKPKSVAQAPIVPVAETVAVAPVVSKRPVRINLADQEIAPTQSVVSEKTSVDFPARSIQKSKSVAQVPVVPVAETVAVAPVVSKRPVRINLADQETAPTQPTVTQRTSVDFPPRSIQKSKSVVNAPVAPVAEKVVVETPTVSKRPVRTNVSETETTLVRPTITSPKKVVVAAEPKMQKAVVQAPVERPQVKEIVSAPETTERPVRVNLAEQEAKISAATPLAKQGIRPRTQVTSSKSLVDDTIAPLVETTVPQARKLADKADRVNLAEESPKVEPVTNTISKTEDISVSKSVAPVVPPKTNTTQRVIKTINNRQYIVKAPVEHTEESKIVSDVPAAKPLVDTPAPVEKAKPRSVNGDEKAVPVLARKKLNNKSSRQSVNVAKADSDGKQIAKLVESDAIPIDKARSIAAELDLKFGFNSKELLSEESDKVLPLSEILKENVDINLRIVGHTDNVGSLKANYIMGNSRALVVKQLFAEQGVSDKQLTTTSRAYLEPLAPNVLGKDMAKNRRVEVKVLKPGTSVVESKALVSEKSEMKRNDKSSMTVNDRIYNQFIATVEMEEGSRLTLVSKKYYGARDFWVYIYEANKDLIANPDIVAKGTMIRVPKLPSNLIDVNNPACIEKARALHDLYVK